MPTHFKLADRYLLRRLTPQDFQRHGFVLDSTPHPTWGVFLFGAALPFASCAELYVGGSRMPYLPCKGSIDFNFNFQSLRFQSYRYGGYVDGHQPESKDDTPTLEIGRCTED